MGERFQAMLFARDMAELALPAGLHDTDMRSRL